jgi:hypothetical protein
VPAIVVCTGLACGMLLAAVGLGLWDGFRQIAGLSHAVRVVGWLAGGFLLIGAVLAWYGDHSLSAPTLRLTLMAALAAPPEIHRRPRSSWNSAMLILPSLVLAGASLFWASPWAPGPTVAEASSPTFTLVESGPPHLWAGIRFWGVIVCGGLGARALGKALSKIIASTRHVEGPALSKVEGPFVATYALLTLLVGSTALVNLCQRGTMWAGTPGAIGEGGPAGAWLAWSAAWLGPRQFPRLQAVLTTVAASLLIVLAAGY